MKRKMKAAPYPPRGSRPAGARGLKPKMYIPPIGFHTRRAPQGRVD